MNILIQVVSAAARVTLRTMRQGRSFYVIVILILAIYLVSHQWRHAKHGLGGLAPTVKHTGQESGGELCEIFKF